MRTLAAIVVSFAALGASSASGVPTASWPQFRATPGHAGENQIERVLGPRNVSRLRAGWQAPGSGDVWSSPAVEAGRAYFASNGGRLDAVDTRTGAVRWRAPISRGFSSGPAVARGVVYVLDSDSIVWAFRADTGAVLWRTAVSAVESGFLGSVNVVPELGMLFVMRDGLSAIELATGKVLWQAGVDAFGSSPAVSGNTVVIGAQNNTGDGPRNVGVYGFDAHTGTQLWARLGLGEIDSPPAIWKGTVLIATYAGDGAARRHVMNALRVREGSVLWKAPLGRSKYLGFAAPAIDSARRVVYFPSVDGNLYALGVTSGTRLWRRPLGTTSSSPAVANGVIYVGSDDKHVYAFGRDGERLWASATAKTEVVSSPAVANGVVYVGVDRALRTYRLPR